MNDRTFRKRAIALTIATAFAVGCSLAFVWLDIPAAWISGGLFGAVLAVLCGQKLVLPNGVVNVSYVLLGALFGSAIRPSIAGEIVVWAGTLAMSCASLAAIMIVSTFYMKRFEGWDLRTAFFATAPGALPAVIALATEHAVDHRRVVLAQTVRLFSFMAVVPLLFSGSGGGEFSPGGTMETADLVIVLAAAALGGLVAKSIRLPGGLMVGALIASGALYGLDMVHGEMPAVLQNGAMMAMGMFVGAQLALLTLPDLWLSLRAVAAMLALGTTIAVGFSWVTAVLADLPFVLVLLSFLPGAMEGMAALGFILGLDVAFISLHHIVRFLFVVLSLPIVTRAWK